MHFRLFIFSYIILFSCAPYSIYNYTKQTETYLNNHRHGVLDIYLNPDEIEGEYNKIAKIKIKNNRIYGSLRYDERMKKFLLKDISEIGGCSLLVDDQLSDSLHTYFDVINIRCCENKEWKSYNDIIDASVNQLLYINPCDSSDIEFQRKIIYD